MNKKCIVENCERLAHGRGLCPMHYRRWRLYGDHLSVAPPRKTRMCEVDGCTNRHMAHGLCCKHYRRLKMHGDTSYTRVVGKKFIHSAGYVVCYKPEHPNANKAGQILEHVLVMSEYLGRSLYHGETVHHMNGNRADNNIANLELWATSHPPGQRIGDLVRWAKEILERYGDYSLEQDTRQTPLIAVARKE